jgi:hypothetical protein
MGIQKLTTGQKHALKMLETSKNRLHLRVGEDEKVTIQEIKGLEKKGFLCLQSINYTFLAKKSASSVIISAI